MGELKNERLLTSEEIIDLIANRGVVTLYKYEDLEKAKEMEEMGLLLNCGKISHREDATNPDYSYVENSDRGRRIAISHVIY